MNNDQQHLRQQLRSLIDSYLMLGENPVWQSLTDSDLEQLRQNAIESADLLWWRFRTRCGDFNQNL